jgi:hypothetical protein
MYSVCTTVFVCNVSDGYNGYNFVTGTSAQMHTSGGMLSAYYSGKLVRIDLSNPATVQASSIS